NAIEQGWLEVEFAGAVVMSAPDWFDAGLHRAIDETLYTLVMLGRDERAHAGGLFAGVANDDVRQCGAEFREELVRDFGINEDAGAREADLGGIEVLAGGGLRGGIEVGIGADDEWGFAAELETGRSE